MFPAYTVYQNRGGEMNDHVKTKAELIKEFSCLNQRIRELEKSDAEHKRAQEALQPRKQYFIAADTEFLPYRESCFDLVISSFTLQWLEQWDRAAHEIFRVLKPGGIFLCAAFGEQTFKELKASFVRACGETGYNHGEALRLYGSQEHCFAALRAAGFIKSFATANLLTQHYQSVADLIRSIKGMGAQNASPRRNRGLGMRRIWDRMIALYEADFRQQDGIAATYQVIMGGGQKPSPAFHNERRHLQLK